MHILPSKTTSAWKLFAFGVFLLRIFQYLDWICRDILYLFVFNLNVEKYGPEKLRIRTLFTQRTQQLLRLWSSKCLSDWLQNLGHSYVNETSIFTENQTIQETLKTLQIILATFLSLFPYSQLAIHISPTSYS